MGPHFAIGEDSVPSSKSLMNWGERGGGGGYGDYYHGHDKNGGGEESFYISRHNKNVRW